MESDPPSKRVTALSEEAGEIFYDAEGRPTWGNKAAGILIRRSDTGAFLLLLRSSEVVDPGVLSVPGGRVEPGETPEETALFEAQEELGPLPPLQFVGSDVHRSGDFTFTTFLAVIDGQDAAAWEPVLNWESDAWVWAYADEIHELGEVHPNARRVIEAWP